MRRKALIVEDDPQTRRLLGKIVESQDFEIHEAGDGAKAIEMLDASDYDVVLLDIVLPKISGTAVMDHLYVTNPAMLERIIVVTGLNVEDIRKLFPTVCQAISKPVMPKRLMDSIHACLGARLDEHFTAQ
jgi:CheY-like chemotaxis protein